MPNSGIHILGVTISAWVYAPVLFVLWLVFFYSAKASFFRTLRSWSQKSANPWGDNLIKSLRFPANVLILGGGLALLERLLPLPREFDQPAELAVKVLVIVALFFLFDRLFLQLLHHFAGKVRTIDLSGGIIQGVVRLTILAFGLMILLDALGISITPLVASLGIGSLAVALGLQETLANFFAGLYIVAEQPVRVGDFVRLEAGEEGYVTDIGWRNTRIRTLQSTMVIIPNSKIISSTIRNYYLPDKEMAAVMEVGVHYASDLAKVERVTIEVAREIQKKVPGAVSHFEPFIRFHTFADSSIHFNLILRVREFTDQHLVKHELIKALHERYQKEGIVIPYPIRTLDLPAETLSKLAARVQREL